MLKRTPLYESHASLGARLVDFAGWEMPVQYSGPIAEHLAVREAAGLFDVSHMGEVEVVGEGALELLQNLTTNDVSKLADNQVQYSALTNPMLDRIPYYWSQRVHIDGVDTRVSRTGYTGEDGFEILCSPENARHLWNRLLITGRDLGLLPCGLAARNTLRLEAAFRLWGHDMDESTTPLEAGLGWIVKLQKGNFIGGDVLAGQKAKGLSRKLVGFEMQDRAPARDGYKVKIGGVEIGSVASGSPAPYLKKNIGLVYLPIEHTAIGTELAIDIRGRDVPARIVETPFYTRKKKFD